MDIENLIKVILKGASDHTEIEEIREKLKHVAAENRPLRVKFGMDPSAPDIHLGHAVPLRKLKQLQDLGCEVTILIGLVIRPVKVKPESPLPANKLCKIPKHIKIKCLRFWTEVKQRLFTILNGLAK